MITEADGTETTYYYLCKGKKKCIKGIDDERFQSYLDEFSMLVDKYRKILVNNLGGKTYGT